MTMDDELGEVYDMLARAKGTLSALQDWVQREYDAAMSAKGLDEYGQGRAAVLVDVLERLRPGTVPQRATGRRTASRSSRRCSTTSPVRMGARRERCAWRWLVSPRWRSWRRCAVVRWSRRELTVADDIDVDALIERLKGVIDTAIGDAYTVANDRNVGQADWDATAADVKDSEAVRDDVIAALVKLRDERTRVPAASTYPRAYSHSERGGDA